MQTSRAPQSPFSVLALPGAQGAVGTWQGGTARADLAPKQGGDGCEPWLHCKADACAAVHGHPLPGTGAAMPRSSCSPTGRHCPPQQSTHRVTDASTTGQGHGERGAGAAGAGTGRGCPQDGSLAQGQSSGDGQRLILSDPSGWVVPKGAVSRHCPALVCCTGEIKRI